MAEIELQDVKKRSVAGILALTSRTGLLQLISSVGFFLLTIYLDLKLFGVFIVIQAASSFLNYFSDIGLAGALIQKKESLTKDDLATTFTVQQLMVLGVSTIALLLSSWVAGIYGLDQLGVVLFRVLILSFILSSLKTIPSILLERELKFSILVIPQVFEVVSFYVIAVLLAWKGFGIESLTYAVLGRAIIGLVMIYIVSPWMPRFGINSKVLKKLLSFGIPLQTNSLLGLIKDDLFTLYLGTVLPLEQISLIGWAKKWADTPLRLVMDSFIRVTFPTYSRLQGMADKLRKGINKSMFFSSILIFPMAVGLILLMKPLIYVIPKYIKWEPALFSFYLFVIAAVFASISTPLTNALNAVGKVTVTLKLMILWTVLTWGLGILLVSLMGLEGVALSAVLISLTIYLVVKVSKNHFSFDVLSNITPALLSSIGMLLVGLFLPTTRYYSIVGLVNTGLILVAVYLVMLRLFFWGKLKAEVVNIIGIMRS